MTSALMLLDQGREVVLLDVPRSVPRGEEAHLAEVAIVGEIQLGPKEQDLAVEYHGARIVSARPVKEGEAHVDDDTVESRILKDRKQRVPRVLVDLVFEEMVQTTCSRLASHRPWPIDESVTVTRNLKLGPNSEACPGRLCLDDALFDPPQVAGEVQAPLIQRARRDSDKRCHLVDSAASQMSRRRPAPSRSSRSMRLRRLNGKNLEVHPPTRPRSSFRRLESKLE